MYSVKPIGLNLKDNDRDVPDGSLLESINMQWRDGSFKPIPERIVSAINATGYSGIILHKVGDENTINVLGFSYVPPTATYLAFDLSDYLGGHVTGGRVLEWFGTIRNGFYETQTAVQLPFVTTPGMSFTILNGIMYAMGDGTSEDEQYFVRIEFDEANQGYKVYDMYRWKSLIPFYPYQSEISLIAKKSTHNTMSQCGLILIRFALVLKSGEVVLHSPIYGFFLYGINRSTEAIAKGDIIDNIHTFINLDLSFADADLFDEEISAINVYATTPYYETKFSQAYPDADNSITIIDEKSVKGTFSKKAEEPFYLIKTIDKPTSTEKILLTVGSFDTDIELDPAETFTYSKIDISTIAAGEIMPVDNYSYHKIYGRIKSYNGRLVVRRPVTVLSGGHVRALARQNSASQQAFSMATEDGDITGISYNLDKAALFADIDETEYVFTRGLMSYPDLRANLIGINDSAGNNLKMFKCRKNQAHNMSCAFNFQWASFLGFGMSGYIPDSTKYSFSTNYSVYIAYSNFENEQAPSTEDANSKYSSDNRVQFSLVGEYRVWPVINSYRIGEGKVMNLGIGSVSPSESQVISPLIIGTTDGIYTVNLDPMGNNFIASITRSKNIPFVSEEILEIDNDILFVSDQGLMVYSNGDDLNLTADFFPQQGNGDYPTQETVFPSYNLLSVDFFGEDGNIYQMADIVTYMRGAIMAYDSRRKNVWCSNAAYPYSLVYNLDVRQWGMSTMVFSEKQEVFSIINTGEEEIYTRYMVRKAGTNDLLILSGEDLTKEVYYHILTRPIKFKNLDDYKVLPRMIARTLLTKFTTSGYFAFGIWGTQELNKYKKSIPLALKKDYRDEAYPDNMRYHIPVDCRKGKYKSITVLQAGRALPESYISSFDFDIYLVDNTKMR